MKDFFFIVLQHLAPQHLLSRIAGRLANCQIFWFKNFLIKNFAQIYKVDLTEAAEENIKNYKSFNDFFSRKLKNDARTWAEDDSEIISPVDGTISKIDKIDHNTIIQAKGKSFTVEALLGGDAELAQKFAHGGFTTIYLSPKDYHRIHMPTAGKLQKMIHVPGALFSVNPVTTAHVDRLFARNERVVTLFETANGPMALVFVGAMIVASIETPWAGLVAPAGKQVLTTDYENPASIHLDKGNECGMFKLGSTVIALFPQDTMNWDEELKEGSTLKMGQPIGFYKS